MSKFTLGQRQFPTLGLRSQQPKNYVGPTLSCYLGGGGGNFRGGGGVRKSMHIVTVCFPLIFSFL